MKLVWGEYMFWFSKKKSVGVTASSPVGKPIKKFTSLQSFTDSETNTQYVTGMGYTVREGNVRLDEKVSIWENEGLIKV